MRFNIFVIIMILSCNICFADTQAFECLPPSAITKEDVSFGKFEYVMKVPGKNIVLHSKPEYKWINSEPVAFVRDSIKYSSKEDTIDCVYRTDSSQNGLDNINEIDLKYQDRKSDAYHPETPNLWREVANKEVECSDSSIGCSIKVND